MASSRKLYDDKIRELAIPVIEDEGMELIELECLWMKTRWLIRLYIDKPGGVTIDDCSVISNQLGDILDVHNVPAERYTLEVSSPGLNRPLTRDKDFVNYRGSKVQLKLASAVEGSKNVSGKLLDYVGKEGEGVVIVERAGKELHIPRSLIKKANVIYEF